MWNRKPDQEKANEMEFPDPQSGNSSFWMSGNILGPGNIQIMKSIDRHLWSRQNDIKFKAY